MSERDPLYVAARRILLDALEALQTQIDAVTVVGAQAVYLRTIDVDLTVAPYTTDADLSLSPERIRDDPLLQDLLRDANFVQEGDPGMWFKSPSVVGGSTALEVDIMIPATLAKGRGRRSVDIHPHEKTVARRTKGLEGCERDSDYLEIAAFELSDKRRYSVRVAGPAGLIVAKLHKIHDRDQEQGNRREKEKDAADIYRLVIAIPFDEILSRMRTLLADEIASHATRASLIYLKALFGFPKSTGVLMAVSALQGAVPEERVVAVINDFVENLLSVLSKDARDLGPDYGEAWDEWIESRDASAWENAVGD